MGKIRMVELAKQKQLKVTDLVVLAKELNMDVKNAMSSVTEEQAKSLLSNIDKIKKEPKKSAVIAESNTKPAEPMAAVEPKKAAPTEVKPATPVAEAKSQVAEKTATAETPAKPQTIEIGKNASQYSNRRTNDRENNQNQGGGYQNRNTNQGGGYQNRNAGQTGGTQTNSTNQGGGYQNRSTNQGGGYQNNNANQSGGYQNRNTNQGGGYQNNNTNQSGGYQNRNTNQGGGYQNNNTNQGGGYQNRNTNQGGGYQNNNTGQGGGYQNRNTGQGGGYQNRNAGQGGGYQNRNGSGMDNRNIDKKLSDISAAVPADTAVKTTRTSFAENKDRRNTGEERKSKKQLKEEKRLEDKKMYTRNRGRGRGPKPVIVRPDLPKFIKHKGSLTVGELSQQIGITVADIIKFLLGLDIMATINHSLDADTIEIIAAEYDATIEYEETVDETDLSLHFESEDEEKDMVSRPPVITIMGHVDHGKTTLLDALRKTEVVEGEAGGITQHIGAYQITHEGKKLTFLDTPGHEAFTSMRARGAQITDVAIIVVAADDGVMPQTKEAVEHAKAAEVPIIVAVNKIDKPGADPTRVMQGLTELGLQPEAWGGSTIFVEISAKMGTGLENLLEMILLVSEIQELKANPKRNAFGTVVEARLDKGRGTVATVLVQGGTLKIGDPIVVGSAYGRVRTMEDDFGKRLKTAGPSTPVELTGLVGVPSAGDQFAVFESEKKARQVGETRAESFVHEQRRKSSAMNLEDLNQQILEGDVKEINIIVKGDVQGSVEAVSQSFAKIDVAGVRVKIVRAAVGAITESDVMLAVASNAIIYGFNVRPDANTRQIAEREGVSIRIHAIIYKAIEEIEAAMTGMLDPEFEEVITGQVSVRALFKVSKIGTIAGCMVTEGEVKRDSLIRIIRDGIMIYEGKLGSLKREQDDAKSVASGYECGLTIDGYNDLKEGDVIECYEMQEIKNKKK